MTIPAPFVSTELTVLPEWIDFNGHLNMAYYNVLFDQCADQAYALMGIGPDYVTERGYSSFTAEFHVCYVRELHEGDRVRVSFQMLDADEKRFHSYQEIHHVDGWLAATAEAMALHIDMSGPRVAPFPNDVHEKVRAMHAAHAGLPWPERAGRQIGIQRKE